MSVLVQWKCYRRNDIKVLLNSRMAPKQTDATYTYISISLESPAICLMYIYGLLRSFATTVLFLFVKRSFCENRYRFYGHSEHHLWFMSAITHWGSENSGIKFYFIMTTESWLRYAASWKIYASIVTDHLS